MYTHLAFSAFCPYDEVMDKNYNLAKALTKISGSHMVKDCGKIQIYQSVKNCDYKGVMFGQYSIEFDIDNLTQSHTINITDKEILPLKFYNATEEIEEISIEPNEILTLKKNLRRVMKKKTYTEISLRFNDGEITGIDFLQFKKSIFGNRPIHQFSCGH